MSTKSPLLLSPLKIRGVEFKNRIAIAPMCQYSARDGIANDWHLVHLGRFAMGGAGLVMAEATAVSPEGRITHGDLGLWSDAQIPALKRVTDFVRSLGSVPAVQLAHAGRKASMQKPWHGNGPLTESDFERGDLPWEVIAASPIPVADGWLLPKDLTVEDLERTKQAWVDATRRACEAGFDVIEIHGAHGYFLHSFLSPISNKRTDQYGGSFDDRCRYPLEVIKAVRDAWPDHLPLLVRLSCVDGVEGGWALEDTVKLARELRAIGVDLVDCSSGGLSESATAKPVARGLGFQVPFSSTVRNEADIATIAVGLVLYPEQAEEILQQGDADMIAVGREAMFDPNWAHHCGLHLAGPEYYEAWPEQAGWWLDKRARGMAKQARQTEMADTRGIAAS